jgi:hypothetical protein
MAMPRGFELSTMLAGSLYLKLVSLAPVSDI